MFWVNKCAHPALISVRAYKHIRFLRELGGLHDNRYSIDCKGRRFYAFEDV
jgi:hypothetical protein